jgi:hypothetical protein
MWFMDLGCQGKLSNQKLESGDHRLSQGGPVRLESEVPSCKAHTQSSPLMSNEPVHHVSVKQGRKLVWSLGRKCLLHSLMILQNISYPDGAREMENPGY